MENLSKAIIACMVLHNICIDLIDNLAIPNNVMVKVCKYRKKKQRETPTKQDKGLCDIMLLNSVVFGAPHLSWSPTLVRLDP